jgi:hypothetical protein
MINPQKHDRYQVKRYWRKAGFFNTIKLAFLMALMGITAPEVM